MSSSRQNDADLAKNLILATSPLPQTPIQLDGHEEDIDEPNEDNLNNIGILLEDLYEKKYTLNINLNKEDIDVSLKVINNMINI